MKAIRRSLKGEKEQKPQPISIAPKAPTAIIPPRKVIKALYDYEPQNKNGHELAFHKGDFFHVLSRENDTEWYEACNPLIPSARGLVPVAFFEVISKRQRSSGNSVGSAGERADGHDSGFSEKGVNGNTFDNSNGTRPQHSRGPSMTGRGGGNMVYGVVQYDFNAERPDELEARAGEAIIVVAQSNPEWFVAKPIGRLGGPGLIPVAFVDIKDTITMQSVSDPLEAVRKAGVPRVEEWKKLAADYKNSSITLGKFDASPSQLTGGMGRMSIQSPAQQQTQQIPPSSSGYHPMPVQQPQQQNLTLAPISASVPSYCFDNDTYWFVIECQMEDGRWFELQRCYTDFYDFQITLLESFPEEAGNRGKPRTLPFMPGPVAHVTDAIANGRRQNLDEYIKKIVSMPPHISKSMLVRNLFKPRPPQDFEIDPNAMNEDYRLSGGSQQSLQRIQSNQAPHSQSYDGMPPPSARSSHQRGQLSMSANGGAPPPLLHQASNLTQASQSSSVRAANPGGALKIKVFFQDEIIAIRVPQDITFSALVDKLTERLKVHEAIIVQYRDERTGSLMNLQNDDQLDAAIQNNPNLRLEVNYAAG